MGLFSKDIASMDDLFVHQLQDIYYAEKRIVGALPDVIAKASSPELKSAFEAHHNVQGKRIDRGVRLRNGRVRELVTPVDLTSACALTWPYAYAE